MNKKILKKFLIFIACFFILGTVSFADNFKLFDYKDYAKESANENLTNTTEYFGGTIINSIKIVGTGVSMIMIVFVAIKYISAAPNEKAEFKKTAMVYLCGAILVFATSNIFAIIEAFVNKNIIQG